MQMHLKSLVFILVSFCFQSASSDNLTSRVKKKLQSDSSKDFDDTPTSVIAEVVRKIGGGALGNCHVVVYSDARTVSKTQLRELQDILGVPVTHLDVTKLKFGLLTAKGDTQKTLPIVNLLKTQNETDRCRIIIGWSATHFQRGLLILARFQPGLLRNKDTIVLVSDNNQLDNFIPEIENRVVIRKEKRKGTKSPKTSRSTETRYIIETSCQNCPKKKMTRLGEWGNVSGLSWREKKTNYDLKNRNLVISYTNSIPNIFKIDNETFDGVEFRMLEYASTVLNFKYTLVSPKDGHWGRYVNGTWTGKVGDIVNKKADIAIGGIVYKSLRAKFTTYSVMFHSELWGIVCPTPTRLPLWPSIMFPFRSEIAQSVFSYLVAFHLVAFIIVTFLSDFDDINKNSETHPLAQSIQTVFRTAVSFYFRFLAAVYFCNLFYCIIEPQYEDPVNSSSDLLKSSRYFGLVRGTTVESVLSNSLEHSHRKMIQDARSLSSISEGLFNLEKNGMCIVGVPKRYAQATITTRYTTSCGEPGLQVSQEDLHTVMGGWLMAKKSPLKELFDPIIMRLQGFGFIDKWIDDLYGTLSTKRKEKLPCITKPLGPLNLQNLRIAFLLVIAGCVLSVVLFAFEHLVTFVKFFYESPRVLNEMHSEAWMPERRFSPPQRTWPEQVLGRISRNNSTSQVVRLREAMFRYHMNLLLQNSDTLSKSENINRNISVKSDSVPISNTVSPQLDSIEYMSSEHTSERISTTPSDIEHSHAATVGENNDIQDEDILVQEVVVRPYQTRLARAIRLLPWNNSESSSSYPDSHPKLPEAPDSPPPRLPSIKELTDTKKSEGEKAMKGKPLNEDSENSSEFVKVMMSLFSSDKPSDNGKNSKN